MRLIDAEDLEKFLRILESAGAGDYSTDGIISMLEKQPTIEAEPVVHGNWSLRCETHADTHTGEVDEEFYLECSECKRKVWGIDQDAVISGNWRKLTADYPYCHCGAKMDKGEDDVN